MPHFEVDIDALDHLVSELKAIKAELEHIGGQNWLTGALDMLGGPISVIPGPGQALAQINILASVGPMCGDDRVAMALVNFINNWKQGRDKIVRGLDAAIRGAEQAAEKYREADDSVAQAALGEGGPGGGGG